jgi:outer membrane receptor protein involved in Fe transport
MGLAGLAVAVPATAQDEDGGGLEEIIVISKSRGAVSVMDVPTAITAVTGAQIDASGITNMEDLQQNVPGLIVGGSQTTTTKNFSIRGIGSTSNNFGVESSVGLYVDNVYRSRQSSMINELVDVEAVEVLRGPQGTLFGKNTAAGAIQVRTVAPSTDSVDGFFELQLGNYDLRRVAAAANIPLTDKLAFRGTIFSSDRDGYVANHVYDLFSPIPSIVVQDDLFNDRDRFGLRAQLGYDNGDDLTIRVIADYSEIDEICCIGTSRIDSVYRRSTNNPEIGDFGPDFARLLTGGIVFTDRDYPDALPTTTLLNQMQAGFAPFGIDIFDLFGLPFAVDLPFPNLIEGVGWDDYITSVNFAPVSKNEDRGLSVEINKDFDNGTTLTSITALRAFDTYDSIDADFTNSSLVERINDAAQDSISQELRLAGSFGDGSTWVVGGYYFAQEIKSNTFTSGGSDLLNFIDLDRMIQGDLPLAAITGAVDQLSAATGGLIPPGAEGFPDGIFANDDVLQDHSGYALFGQVDWALSDAFTLTLGARFTDETKDIDAVYTQTNPGVLRFDDDPLTGTVPQLFAELAAWAAWNGLPPIPPSTAIQTVALPNEGWGAWTFPPLSPRPDVQEKLDEDQITGTVKLSWYPNDNAMLYASFATGFKSGGTNADRIEYDWDDPDNPLFSQLFDAEESTSIEVGFKGDLTDNMRLSVSAYQTDFENFQANTFEGSGFILRNAGDLEIKGIEIEWLWQVMDNTSVTGYFAHNSGEYISFLNGVEEDAAAFHIEGFVPSNDKSGREIAYNPENRYFVALTQDFPMGSNNMFFRAEYTWLDGHLTDGDLDPLTKQDSFGILNLRLGVDIDDWNSTITLWGRNVTDERYFMGSFDPPLLDRGTMNSYPSDPAMWGVTFRKHWD